MRRVPAALAALLITAAPVAALAQYSLDPDAQIARSLVADQGLFHALAQNNIPGMAALRNQGADPNATLSQLGMKPVDVFGNVIMAPVPGTEGKLHRPEPQEPMLRQPVNTASWPILTWAVHLDNQRAANLLMRAGARVNAPDEYGATPLHWAAWEGRHSLAKQLLNNGASCQARDFRGLTPKDWALAASQYDMVQLLDSRSCRAVTVLDSDRDGVPDDMDMCPNTPLGAPVDERGCWVVAYATFFDFDRDVVKREFIPHLQQAARILSNNPGLPVTLVGHTDSRGTDEYNMDLGYRRAEAVRRHLVRYGVSADRLSVLSSGESEPIDTNGTARGRARNRRVEIHVNEAGAAPN
ncbi:MAG: OmpA family protein [Deltaproteobacteria bacterium]|jgi:outer membrane protein OmpA-like peptidoglycan-associated protein|nr:OmpA family protein [Deltaproteobacteria bacterium]